jgi:hypothetical protein
MNNDTEPQFIASLRRGVVDGFNADELRTLCADLGVDYETLGGEGKEAKTRELIFYLDRRGRISDLLAYCASARPNYAWPQKGGEFPTTPDSTASGVTAKISILFSASDPTDMARLRLGEELREIQDQLRSARFRDHFDIHNRTSVRPADLSQALLDVQPQIVHFSGHGTADGALCFENQVGQVHPIEPDALAALFEQFSDQIDCILLNACYSEIQAKAIAKHINYVIGMNRAIRDTAAIAFAVGFYQAIGAGRTIKEAYKLGCVQIRLQGIPDHLTPVLLERG